MVAFAHLSALCTGPAVSFLDNLGFRILNRSKDRVYHFTELLQSERRWSSRSTSDRHDIHHVYCVICRAAWLSYLSENDLSSSSEMFSHIQSLTMTEPRMTEFPRSVSWRRNSIVLSSLRSILCFHCSESLHFVTLCFLSSSFLLLLLPW